MGSFVHFLNATMSESPWIETKPDKEPSRRLIYWLGPQWLWRGWNVAGLEPNYTLLWPIFSPFNSHSLLTSTSNPTSLWRSQETFRNVLAQQAISFLWPTGRACHQIASVVCSRGCLSCSNSLPDVSNSVFEPLSGFMVFFVLLLWNVMIPLLLEHWVWGSPSLCSWVTLIPIWVQKKKKKISFLLGGESCVFASILHGGAIHLQSITGKIGQQGKALVTIDLSSIPMTHVCKQRTDPKGCPLTSTCVHMHIHTQYINQCSKIIKKYMLLSGMVMYTFNLHMWEAEAGRFLWFLRPVWSI